jgi:hypothetical protein
MGKRLPRNRRVVDPPRPWLSPSRLKNNVTFQRPRTKRRCWKRKEPRRTRRKRPLRPRKTVRHRWPPKNRFAASRLPFGHRLLLAQARLCILRCGLEQYPRDLCRLRRGLARFFRARASRCRQERRRRLPLCPRCPLRRRVLRLRPRWKRRDQLRPCRCEQPRGRIWPVSPPRVRLFRHVRTWWLGCSRRARRQGRRSRNRHVQACRRAAPRQYLASQFIADPFVPASR